MIFYRQPQKISTFNDFVWTRQKETFTQIECIKIRIRATFFHFDELATFKLRELDEAHAKCVFLSYRRRPRALLE